MSINATIRTKILKQRWKLSPTTKTKYDHIIYNKILEEIKNCNPKKYIALYWPIENEVDTIALIHELLKSKYKICIPHIKHKRMYFKPIMSIHFEYEYWKSMRQPRINSFVNKKDIELMIVPLIGFNKTNHRLGYGLHFYNDFLHSNSKIHTIGLAYDFQFNNEFTVTRYDKILNKIVTN